MKENFHFKTSIPLIDAFRIHFIVCNDIRKAHEEFNLKFDGCSKHGAESHMEDDAFDIYIFIEPGHLTYGVIAHELNHTKNQLFGRIGYHPAWESDEMESRVIEFMHDWVYSKLIHEGQEIHHGNTKKKLILHHTEPKKKLIEPK